MRLADAIRLGAMLAPPGTGGRMDEDTRCALASAAEAVGLTPVWDTVQGHWIVHYTHLTDRFPVLSRTVRLPEGHHTVAVIGQEVLETTEAPLMHAIWYLNDSARWSREAIAEWVDSLEPQDALPEALGALQRGEREPGEG